MPDKVKVAIIGTGNIGSDLLVKVLRSPLLECGMFTGRHAASRGIQMAEKLGVPVGTNSIQAIEDHPDCCEIVFDATSAQAHIANYPILRRLGKFSLDLTPAAIGPFCIPVINLEESLDEPDLNLVTCGGQAAIPLAWAISRVHPDTRYFELVASISSKSAGPGTRNNIDEFTQTTRTALSRFTGIAATKAIIILNPAEPPITMRNTVYALIDHPDMEAIRTAVSDVVSKIRQYVPGYRLTVPPVFEAGRLVTSIEVTGRGDFLPPYSGNLDIITSAAVHIAEAYAAKRPGRRLT